MNIQVTKGISISVETFYQEKYSNVSLNEYVFAYRIIIENLSDFTVKLLSRHWFIYNANGQVKEVEGEGVVGKQPVIQPGDRYQYVSGCPLKSEIGKMRGTYLMEREIDGKTFEVSIPEFKLISPMKLN